MIVTRKAISRRTILRGMGATVALPLLDAMIPALTAAQNTPAKAVRRLGVVYHPNGVIYEKWLPKGVGANFELSPTLAGLQPFKDQLIVVTGLFMDLAEALGDGGGDHSRASGGYLSGVHVKKSDAVVEGGISMDQIAARAFERETQLSSLQLQMDDNSLVGSCDVGYSCAYSSTISWLTPTLPLMTENNPRVVFERLFGATDSTDPGVRAARLRQDRSILDSVRDRVKQLQRQLGAADNTRVNDYLTSLRDVERRIQKTEEQSAKEVPDVARPAGIPESFDEHAHLLYDLQLLAYQADITRVITFMYGREQSPRPYPQIGVPEPHHSMTHHQNDPVKMEKCVKIQQYHLKLFTDYLEKLRNTPDGDGSLLDHMIILYGGGISNSDRHTHGPLPTLVVGGGGGALKGGRHLVYPEHTPLTNLQLTLLNVLGVPTEKIGDSTGQFKELSEVGVSALGSADGHRAVLVRRCCAIDCGLNIRERRPARRIAQQLTSLEHPTTQDVQQLLPEQPAHHDGEYEERDQRAEHDARPLVLHGLVSPKTREWFWDSGLRQSERAAALFDGLLVDHHPADRNAIQNDPNPPLGLWLCDYAKGAIVLRRARVGVDDPIGNPHKTRALGPILQGTRQHPLPSTRLPAARSCPCSTRHG